MIRAGTGNRRDTRSAGRSRSGHAAVETALMAPWIFLLFLVVFDLGFYSYAVISTQNAARSAAMHASRSTAYAADLTRACLVALRELQGMPNVGPSLTNCANNATGVGDSTPIGVEIQVLRDDSTGNLAPQDPPVSAVRTNSLWAVRVLVTYRSPQLFPLPGLMGRITVTRFSEARIREL